MSMTVSYDGHQLLRAPHALLSQVRGLGFVDVTLFTKETFELGTTLCS